MKYLALIMGLIFLASCSDPSGSSQTLQDGEVRTVYTNEATGEHMTPLEFMEAFKVGGEVYNTKEFSKVPEDVRIELRNNLTLEEFKSLPIEVQELLPLETKGTGMSSEDIRRENIELLQNMSPEELGNISIEDRKSLALTLTKEDLQSLPSDLQPLLTFEQ